MGFFCCLKKFIQHTFQEELIMITTATKFESTLSVEEQIHRGITPGTRLLGEKKCYLTLEDNWDRAYFNGELNVNGKTFERDRSRTMTALRLSITFEDKSTTHFTIHATELRLAVASAPYFVQEIVNTLKVDRVVWEMEGSNDVHLAAYSKSLNTRPGSLIAKLKNLKANASAQLDKFFFVDDLEY